MKVFRLTEIADDIYEPHGKNLFTLMAGLKFKINTKSVSKRVAILNSIKFLLHSAHFMQTEELNVIDDMMVDHKYGNTDVVICPGYRYLAKINLFNEVIKYVKSKTEGFDDKDIYFEINPSMAEYQVKNIFNNKMFLNMVSLIRRVVANNNYDSDVLEYFRNPLIDPLDSEWKHITDAICNALTIDFGLTSEQLVSLADYRYELMDKSIPNKAFSEKMKKYGLSSDDVIVTKLV